jgi:LL-diaminopimelate aminotransferase
LKHSFSQRVLGIQELIFRKLDALRSLSASDLVDLSRGLPQGLPPREVLSELSLRLKYPENHIYTTEKGLKYLREEVAYFYKDRYDVDLDPETEVQILIGGKDGLASIAQACVDNGESAIVPDPGFPAFANCVRLAGGTPLMISLREENNYMPDMNELKALATKKPKLMYINYPHNPTGAICTVDDFNSFLDFAKEHNIVLCYDAVYRDLAFKKHPTILEIDGAKDNCVEIGSLSKTFDMVGWRTAYMVGNKDIIAHVRKVKSVFDVGQFVPIQYSAALALKMTSYIDEVARKYEKKMEETLKLMQSIGLNPYKSEAAFFVWTKLPEPYKSSETFINDVWEQTKVLLMPGLGFGESGEGYFRISTTADMEKIREGISRLKSFLGKNDTTAANI